jgi:hypothetical protein
MDGDNILTFAIKLAFDPLIFQPVFSDSLESAGVRPLPANEDQRKPLSAQDDFVRAMGT